MNDSTSALVAMFVAGAGIETYREIKAGHFPPRPFRFTGLAAVYALLAMLGKVSGPLAAVLGLGMLIALVVKAVPSSAPQGGQGGGQAPAKPAGPVSV